jgi:carbon dioxide concentrating mechanism protein CcmO
MNHAVEAIGIFEVGGFTPAMVGLDAMEKGAEVRVIQAELNDFLGTVIKIEGTVASVRSALAAGEQAAQRMGAKPIVSIIPRPDADALAKGIMSKQERSPLLDQNVVLDIRTDTSSSAEANVKRQEPNMSSNALALGFIETQGFTAVFEAIDAACKSANVEVVAKEKLGGGYITVVIRGDVAAVSAAIDSGKAKVEGLGKLIAAHVIARPSAQVLSLLPK